MGRDGSSGVRRLMITPRLLPVLVGRPIEVRMVGDIPGHPVGGEAWASSSIPGRRILLYHSLAEDPDEFCRILIHELFHFVWVRLGNPRRIAWEGVLSAEFEGKRHSGELGYSAEWRKQLLTPEDRQGRTRGWRSYAAESFCDTAAWIYAEVADGHPEVTLGARDRNRRRRWFEQQISPGDGRPVVI